MKRSVVSVILFSIITCGIYSIYWFIVTTNDIESHLQEKDGSVSSGGMAFLLSIITCSIYTIYWYYKQGKRIGALKSQAGLAPSDNSVLYVILGVLGFGIINYAIMQSELNEYYDKVDANPA